MKLLALLVIAGSTCASAFVVSPRLQQNRVVAPTVFMSEEDIIEFESEAEKEEAVGNLVADDEWNGLGLELSAAISKAISEDLKRNARDFLGKDSYEVGDISKEVDKRVKDEIASFRGKEDYELGDLVLAMDEMSKSMTEEITGKPYETGDLSKVIDTKIKASVADFCGKDEYEFGDLSKEIDKRVRERVSEWSGKGYAAIANEVETRRKEWIKDVLGEEAAANYQFGDLTKKAITNFTGKDDYQFGDVTKKLMGNLFNKKK